MHLTFHVKKLAIALNAMPRPESVMGYWKPTYDSRYLLSTTRPEERHIQLSLHGKEEPLPVQFVCQ